MGGGQKNPFFRAILGYFWGQKYHQIGPFGPWAPKWPKMAENGQIAESRVSAFTSPKIIHLLKGPGQSQSAASCSAISGRKVLSAKVGETGDFPDFYESKIGLKMGPFWGVFGPKRGQK